MVTLDGSTSTDPDPGDSIASYRWEQTAGSPSITLNGANTAKATFTAPSVTADTTFTFKLTVTDKQSVSSSTSVNVIVQKDTQQPPSNQPPDTSKATPSTGTLWPPNHKMVKITIQNVIDPDGNGECHNTASNSFEDISKSKSSNNEYDNNMGKSSSNIKQNIKQSCDIEGDSITIKITRIMQDEPVNGLGDGDASPDATGIGTDTAFLRAERAGNGDGRVYHIYFTATDSEGLSSNGEVIVSVPHDQSGRKAIDSGPKYDSTLKSSIVDTTPPAIVGTTP